MVEVLKYFCGIFVLAEATTIAVCIYKLGGGWRYFYDLSVYRSFDFKMSLIDLPYVAVLHILLLISLILSDVLWQKFCAFCWSLSLIYTATKSILYANWGLHYLSNSVLVSSLAFSAIETLCVLLIIRSTQPSNSTSLSGSDAPLKPLLDDNWTDIENASIKKSSSVVRVNESCFS